MLLQKSLQSCNREVTFTRVKKSFLSCPCVLFSVNDLSPNDDDSLSDDIWLVSTIEQMGNKFFQTNLSDFSDSRGNVSNSSDDGRHKEWWFRFIVSSVWRTTVNISLKLSQNEREYSLMSSDLSELAPFCKEETKRSARSGSFSANKVSVRQFFLLRGSWIRHTWPQTGREI